MNEPIVARARIAQEADEAARAFVSTGIKPENPYPVDSDAARAWKVTFERYLLQHSAPDAEASA